MQLARLLQFLLVGILWPLCAAAAETPSEERAKAIVQQAGFDQGLCLHLGCGQPQSSELTAALAAGSRMLVHGLALDAAAQQRAHSAILTHKLLGQARAEVLSVKPLPFLPHSANLVVIEDWALLQNAGLTLEEVQRVTQPQGIILIFKDGQWTKTVKPRPAEMDEWTHPAHGSDNNRVSSDKLIQFPLGVRWLDGVPKNLHSYHDCLGLVSAGGRLFSLSSSEIENVGFPEANHIKDEYLQARDAFTGLTLWKIKCPLPAERRGLQDTNAAAIATDGAQVYVGRTNQIEAYDAASGKQSRVYPTKLRPYRLLLLEDELIACCWEGLKSADYKWNHANLYEPLTPISAAGEVQAFQKSTGKPLWSIPKLAQFILVADGQLYVMFLDSATKAQTVTALDPQTGKEKWSVPHTSITPSADLRFNVGGSGVLVVSSLKDKIIKVLDAQTGQVLWDSPPKPYFFTPLVKGQLWLGGRRDIRTGQVQQKMLELIHNGGTNGCSPGCLIGDGDYLVAARTGSYTDLRPSTPPKLRNLKYGGLRAGCLEGAIAANGLLYAPQNGCRCIPAQFPGFAAVGYNGDPPAAAAFQAARLVETGPAFGQVAEQAPTPTDWPSWMRDAARSSCTSAKLPAALKIQWQTPIATPPEGPLAAAWKSRLIAPVTAPVVAGQTCYLASYENGEVVAVDASGLKLWQTPLGSRIDTPPTLQRGYCLVGCHDGWLYALRSSDGKLAWRTHIAPADQKMVAYGQVESLWPVVGSVLAAGDQVYASAGRSSDSDGGLAVAALDLVSGKTKWASQIPPGSGRQNDALALRDGKLTLLNIQIDPADGKVAVQPLPTLGPNQSYRGTQEGMQDSSWTWLGTRRSGRVPFGYTLAEMYALGGDKLWGYWHERWSTTQRVFSQSLEVAQTRKTGADEKECLWVKKLPAKYHAVALARCDSGLVLAGRIEGKPDGFLLLVSPDDGEKRFELALPGAPVFQGVAVVEGKVLIALQDGSLLCCGQ